MQPVDIKNALTAPQSHETGWRPFQLFP